ncbi:MAG TPA: metal ABC transporter permease, partial [Aggregatilineales bacterium]|nr:metal ABC transporter permease [Aggregatilineales bacterium]
FSLALAAAVIVSMQRLGVTLIAAAIVIPPITARLLTDRLDRMILISVIMGSITAMIGMYLSYYVDVASGATIVLTQTALFLVAALYSTLIRRNRLAAIHYHV